MGLNVHYNFKPEIDQPTCSLVRNYHNINWDVKNPGAPITFPICVNRVNWETLYSSWTAQGFEVKVNLQFGSLGPSSENYESLWDGHLDWAEQYAYSVAQGLSQSDLATSIEIGNEPGVRFNDDLYQTLFQRMSEGIRRADPEIKIATCTVHMGPADKYHKNLEETFGAPDMLPLFDVINVHVYSDKDEKDQSHPWERSYPEDPAIDYLRRVDEVIEWRDQYAPEKEVWITEFGYDSCTPEAMKERKGWFLQLDWSGQTDLQQAQWTIRSLLCFSAREIDRAYIYFYNDKDEASVHAASGLTRNFIPKPAFWAVQQFQQLLGSYQFSRKLKEEPGHLYAYEFIDPNQPTHPIWVLWSPTGEDRQTEAHLQQLPKPPKSLLKMAVDAKDTSHETSKQRWTQEGQGIRFPVGESPLFLLF